MRTDEVSNARRLYSTSVQTHPTLSEVACGYCGRHAGRSSTTSTTSNTSNTTIVSDTSSLTRKNRYVVSRADVNSVASGTSVAPVDFVTLPCLQHHPRYHPLIGQVFCVAAHRAQTFAPPSMTHSSRPNIAARPSTHQALTLLPTCVFWR